MLRILGSILLGLIECLLSIILSSILVNKIDLLSLCMNGLSYKLTHSAHSFGVVLLWLRKFFEPLGDRASRLLLVSELKVRKLGQASLHTNIFNLILLKLRLNFEVVFFDGFFILKLVQVVLARNHNSVLIGAQGKHVIELLWINT